MCFLVALGLMAAGCGDTDALGVEVSFDSGLPRSARDQAVRVEVYVVESCASVSIGERPDSAIASTFALRDEGAGPSISTVDPGQYGLYAVAQDSSCAVIAAGCVPVTMDAGTVGPLSVTLRASSGPGCAADEQCNIETGECGNGSNVDCSIEPDETPCLAGGIDGLCRMGACCTGCWDGSTCRAGDENVRCGGGGKPCELCGCFSDACVAGECNAVPSFTDLDMGLDHVCAIADDGHLWCWGSHEFGQLGVGDAPASTCGLKPCFTRPTEVNLLASVPSWSQVSAGEGVTCAIRASDSSLWCWGSNTDGRMGAPDTVTDSSEPVLISAGVHRQVDNEARNGCAVRADGSLWCWGDNSTGQVGQGSTGADVYGPLEVPFASDWTEVGVGYEYACAIRQERLWCWGSNGDGQLGNGETGGVTQPATTGFVGMHIDAGTETTCGLASDGIGYCWGKNNYGQVGNGDTSGADVSSPTPVSETLSFDHLSVQDEFSCGVTNVGALYCWGRNRYEKLGIGQSFGSVPQVEVPTRVGTDSDWREISAGGDSACAVRADGSLWCWGRNHRGQLGLGDTSDRMLPTRVCF